jgi:hypothetical protein
MNFKSMATEALRHDVVLATTRTLEDVELQTFNTVNVWPQDTISIAIRGRECVVCKSEIQVAECVAWLAPTSDKKALLAFIKQALPDSCCVLDEVPQSVALEIEANWAPPKCVGDSLELFVNDGVTKTVFKWCFAGQGFRREPVGRGFELMRS